MNIGLFKAIIAMLMVVFMSNLLVEIPINDWLTYGAFSYPLSFLVTEITNLKYGPHKARTVVYYGFLLGLIMSFILLSPRIAIASSVAFLSGQLLDISLFSYLRKQVWWIAPLLSSVLASFIDTAIFFGIAFWGSGWLMYTLALGDFLIKVSIDILMLYPFRLVFIKNNMMLRKTASII